MFVVVFVFTWIVNTYLSLNSTTVVAYLTSFKLFDFCQNLVHYCRGILVKLVICVVPGHWKIKILNLKKRNKFFCFFMFLYPIQGGKNIGSPYLTNKSWFFGKSDVPGQQNKSYIGVMASKNLIFLMFWLSFVYL